MDYSKLPRHDIVCIDMKSFYASCECVMRGLDPLTAKLAVVGDIERNGSVVLASSPMMKSMYGIKTGSRMFEVQKLPDTDIHIVQARMGEYHKMAKYITTIFEEFVPPEAIHIYSVDESWLTFDGTQKIHGTVQEAARKLMNELTIRTGIPSAVGIGDNKFLAKTALDIFGKKTGLAEIRYEDVEEMLYPVDIGEMWGVGKQMKKHFNQMGIFTFGDLAHTPDEVIAARFGKPGSQLQSYSRGIDLSPVIYDENNPPPAVFGFSFSEVSEPVKSAGRGVTLLTDYYKEEDIFLVIRDLIEEVCYILRQHHKAGRTIHLGVGYSKTSPFTGFSRQKTIAESTNDPHAIFTTCQSLFHTFHRKGEPVRTLNVSVGKLSEETFSLFEDEPSTRRRTIADTSDNLNHRFGKGTIMKASALKKESIALDRAKKIKGHYE